MVDRKFLLCHADETVSFSAASSSDVQDFTAARFGIPSCEQQFVKQGETCNLETTFDDSFSSNNNLTLLTVTRVLLGGKGGFGSLIRAQVTKRKKITNFDACRDLDGRRIRHSKAVERIKAWAAKQKEEDAMVASLEDQDHKKKKKKDLTSDVTLDEEYLKSMDAQKLDSVVALGLIEAKKKEKEVEVEQKKKQEKHESKANRLDAMMGLDGMSSGSDVSSEEEETETDTKASSSKVVIELL